MGNAISEKVRILYPPASENLNIRATKYRKL